ncbi:MAG TPA: magnesium transporter [Vicinamibacteria bacterium]|nr:magnesium transporter [Vicinamibacteria bacterium]
MSAESDAVVTALRHEAVRLYPEEMAGLLESQPVARTARLLEAEPPAEAAATLQALSPEIASRVLEELGDGAFAALASAADPARIAPALARLDAAPRERRLGALAPRLAAELRELMAFPPDSAGALMDRRVTTFRSGTTAEAAIERLRTLREREFDDVFLVDADTRLVGTVALEDLAVAPPDRRLDELARGAPVGVLGTAPVEEVLERLQGLSGGLPVVDFEDRLLGVIRQGEMLAAAQEEMSADLQTMVGASRDERALSPAGFAVRRRLPWLNVNLGTAFLAAGVVGLFEDVIARITALAVLLPVVAGQSGNSGAQALAVTMRGLALREVRLSQWRRLILKELVVGMLNGVAIAAVTAAGVYLWSRSGALTAVIGVAMVISMTVAGLAGASVPMIMKALGQDPATASSIVLTTVTDVVGFLSFLGLATLLADRFAAG